MAAAVPFDTLDYARKLETAGVAAPQAEAHAKALAEALSHAVASPDDLKALEGNLGTRIATVESRLAATESRLDTKIDRVSDQLTAKIAAVGSELKLELGGKIDKLGGRIDALGGRIDTLGGRIDSFGGRIDSLGGSIDSVGARIDTLKWLFGLVAAMNIAIFVRLVLNP